MRRPGVGRLVVPDGSAYEGEWADGLRDGRGTLYLASGDQVIKGNRETERGEQVCVCVCLCVFVCV